VAIVQHYTDSRDIAFAEMAAALKGLIWCMTSIVQEPTTITLFTDSSVVYYTLVKETGLTLRASSLLQDLFVHMWYLKNKAGHGLVVWWIPSKQNLADPLTRGVLANPDSQPNHI
jgi:ribonuclease HI